MHFDNSTWVFVSSYHSVFIFMSCHGRKSIGLSFFFFCLAILCFISVVRTELPYFHLPEYEAPPYSWVETVHVAYKVSTPSLRPMNLPQSFHFTPSFINLFLSLLSNSKNRERGDGVGARRTFSPNSLCLSKRFIFFDIWFSTFLYLLK